MRVDAYNAITKVYQSSNVKKQNKAGKAGLSDKLEISQAGRDYQVAKKAVSQAPDIREDKVSQLKAAIDSGTYQVSNSTFADVLLDKYYSSME